MPRFTLRDLRAIKRFLANELKKMRGEFNLALDMAREYFESAEYYEAGLRLRSALTSLGVIQFLDYSIIEIDEEIDKKLKRRKRR